MILSAFLTGLLALQAAPEPLADAQHTASAQTTVEEQAQPGPNPEVEPNIDVIDKKLVKPKKITDKSHPDYIRCKSEAVIGSRAKRKRTCMTNKEWALIQRRGNEASRDFVNDNAAGFIGGNN